MEHFHYDAEKDHFLCPEGQILPYSYSNKKVKRGYIRSPEDSFVNSVNILEYVLNLEEEEV